MARVNKRRATLTQRYNAGTIFHWKKIEPAPDTVVTAPAHGFKIGAIQMTDLDLDFENRSATRACELGSRSRFVRAPRTMQVVNDSHAPLPNTPSSHYSNNPFPTRSCALSR